MTENTQPHESETDTAKRYLKELAGDSSSIALHFFKSARKNNVNLTSIHFLAPTEISTTGESHVVCRGTYKGSKPILTIFFKELLSSYTGWRFDGILIKFDSPGKPGWGFKATADFKAWQGDLFEYTAMTFDDGNMIVRKVSQNPAWFADSKPVVYAPYVPFYTTPDIVIPAGSRVRLGGQEFTTR